MRFAEERWFRVAILVGITVAVALFFAVLSATGGGKSGAPGPTAAPGQKACLDGTAAVTGEVCSDLKSNAVMFKAVGISQSRCQDSQTYKWNAPGQSFECIVGSDTMHVARYKDLRAKSLRLGDYGTCVQLDGGWKLCGENPTNGRWVRTYSDDDLLFYVSADRKDALLQLDTATADEVHYGR